MTKKKNTQMEDAEKNLQDSASKFLSFQPKTKRDKELVDLVNSRLKELAVLDPEYALAMENMIKKPLQEVETKLVSNVKEQVAEPIVETVEEKIPEEIQPKVVEEPSSPIIETVEEVAESAEKEEIYVPNDLDKITQEIVQKSEETAKQVEDEVSQIEEEISEVPSDDQLFIESEPQEVIEEPAPSEEEIVIENNEEPVNEVAEEAFAESATEEEKEPVTEKSDEGEGYPYDELEDKEESGLKKQIIKYLIFLVVLCLAVFFLLRYCSTSKNKLTEQVAPEFISYGDTSKPKPVVEPKKEQPKKEQPKQEKAKAYDMKIEYSSADAAKKADAAAKKAEKEKAKQQAKSSTPKNDTKQGGEKKITNDLTELESYKDKDERICTPDKVPSVGYLISYSSPKNEATAIKTVMILSKEQKVPCGYYWLGDSRTQSKKQLYRVYVGPYATEAEAQSAMSKIQGLASDAKVYTEVK